VRGIVLTEFLDFADQTFPGAARQLAPAPSLGVTLSPVGTYPEDGLRDLVRQLTLVTGCPPADIVRRFGAHLFHRFAAIYPVFFRGARDSLSFLERVHEHVHGDLRRFHPDAELPDLRCARTDRGDLVLEYRSPRAFADLAEGLIAGCIEYFGDDLVLAREDLPAQAGQAARFVLSRPRA
jgi:hypothetical protein